MAQVEVTAHTRRNKSGKVSQVKSFFRNVLKSPTELAQAAVENLRNMKNAGTEWMEKKAQQLDEKANKIKEGDDGSLAYALTKGEKGKEASGEHDEKAATLNSSASARLGNADKISLTTEHLKKKPTRKERIDAFDYLKENKVDTKDPKAIAKAADGIESHYAKIQGKINRLQAERELSMSQDGETQMRGTKKVVHKHNDEDYRKKLHELGKQANQLKSLHRGVMNHAYDKSQGRSIKPSAMSRIANYVGGKISAKKREKRVAMKAKLAKQRHALARVKMTTHKIHNIARKFLAEE